MSVTLKKIANELGMSVSLVSQVLNGKASESRIKKETELIVLNKSEELGYIPNKIARGLRTKKTNTIALLTPNLADPFFAKIIKIVQNELQTLGYNLMILESNDETEKEIYEMKLVQSNGIDGMIIIPVADEYSHIEKLSKNNYPVVLLYRAFKKDIDVSTIAVDHYYNIFQIVSLLVKKGHTKIGLIHGVTNRLANTARLKGYKKALKQNKIVYNKNYVIKMGFERHHGYQGTKKLLELEEPATAIILNGDLQTFGALEAIKEKKLKIPKDIALFSTNILDIASFLFAPISTLIHPIEEMGKTAVYTLIDKIEKKESKKIKIFVKSKLNIIEKSF